MADPVEVMFKQRVNPDDPKSKETKEVTHTLLYNHYAIRLIEKNYGRSISVFNLFMASGRAGFTEQLLLLWAGLEGFRYRYKPSHHPDAFTQDEVGELIDTTFGIGQFLHFSEHPVNVATKDAFTSAFPKEREDGPPKSENPPDAASIGTTSSTPQLSSESERTSSGV
jgi:hypothetical protein